MNILITGATSGIGKSLAIKYAQMGNKIFAIGRNKIELEYLSDNGIQAINTDVTQLDSIKAAYEQITNQVAYLDLIIFNAGICEDVDVNSLNSEIFRNVMNVNFFGISNCLEYFLPLLNKATMPHLVGIASMAYYLPLSRCEAYGASKAAVNYLFESLAIDLPHINVTVVNPGFVKTPLTDKNDFAMPFVVDVEKATDIIIKGIKNRDSEISFPLKLTIPMKILSILPRKWWRKLGLKFKR
jgi:short-subunit dehydrogenase